MAVSNTKLTTHIMGTFSRYWMNGLGIYFRKVLVVEAKSHRMVFHVVGDPDVIHPVDAFVVAVILRSQPDVDPVSLAVKDKLIVCVDDASPEAWANLFTSRHHAVIPCFLLLITFRFREIIEIRKEFAEVISSPITLPHARRRIDKVLN